MTIFQGQMPGKSPGLQLRHIVPPPCGQGIPLAAFFVWTLPRPGQGTPLAAFFVWTLPRPGQPPPWPPFFPRTRPPP